MILGIDTATTNGGVALWDGGLVGVLAWRSERRQTAELVPAIDALFKTIGVTWPAITGVAVAIGPGSFNGIRVGLGTAKAMALARSLPLVPVNTLEAMAWPYRRSGSVAALVPAGRDLALAIYRGTEFDVVRAPSIIPHAELADAIAGTTLLVAEDSPEGDGPARHIISASERVLAVAEIAMIRIHHGALGAEVVEPLYLRRPHITMPRGHQPT